MTERIPTVESRELCLRILRYNPQVPDAEPQQVDYCVEEAPGMTLFVALNEIREQQDPTLAFDFVCRAGICGSCGMLINGLPGLACRTLTASLPSLTILAPLPGFRLIADLSVDTGTWMRGMSEQLETWVHNEAVDADLDAMEAPMDPDLAESIYELERCIECGCCVAACGTTQMRPDFVAAIGLNKLARFRLDPRDTRDDGEFFQLVGDENGVFGCLSLLGCEDMCPKSLPLAGQIAYLRRELAKHALKRKR